MYRWIGYFHYLSIINLLFLRAEFKPEQKPLLRKFLIKLDWRSADRLQPVRPSPKKRGVRRDGPLLITARNAEASGQGFFFQPGWYHADLPISHHLRILAIIRNNAKSSRDRYSLRLRNNAQYGPLNAQRLVTSFITSDQPPRVRISDLRNRRKSPLLLLRRCFPQFFERCPATRESTRYESKAKDFSGEKIIFAPLGNVSAQFPE